MADGWAFHLSEYIAMVTPKEGGETVEEKGKVLEILQRQPDGSWKIAREIWNVAHRQKRSDARSNI